MTRSPRSLMWLWLLCLAGALTQTGLNLLRPITSYKLIALDAGPLTIGITTAAYAILPLFTALWLGRVSDRMYSLRLMLCAGVAMLGIGGAGLALLPSVLGIAAASAVLGLGHLAFTIAGQTSIARIAPDDRLDAGFGWFTASYSVGQMLGPLLGALLVPWVTQTLQFLQDYRMLVFGPVLILLIIFLPDGIVGTYLKRQARRAAAARRGQRQPAVV